VGIIVLAGGIAGSRDFGQTALTVFISPIGVTPDQIIGQATVISLGPLQTVFISGIASADVVSTFHISFGIVWPPRVTDVLVNTINIAGNVRARGNNNGIRISSAMANAGTQIVVKSSESAPDIDSQEFMSAEGTIVTTTP
jgi:hypothetical protein